MSWIEHLREDQDASGILERVYALSVASGGSRRDHPGDVPTSRSTRTISRTVSSFDARTI
jgi:hypothetical protein